MKLTSKEFLWVQAGIIILLLATIDGIVRGPMAKVLNRLEEIEFITDSGIKEYHGNILKRFNLLSELMEQDKKGISYGRH